MKTRLVEFSNLESQSLRGVLSIPEGEVKGALLCLHGFERAGTTEKKFKRLADALADNKVATLRFDFSGCGLSDGDFKRTTVERQSEEFVLALNELKKEVGDIPVSVATHSMGAAALANKVEQLQDEIHKVILLAPALNQKNLLRYWFVIGQMKKQNLDLNVTRNNYRDYLDEDAFMADCQRTDRMSKTSYILPEYFLSGQSEDYSSRMGPIADKVMQIHGLNDITVPYESNTITFKNVHIEEKGNHDIEKPDQTDNWVPKAVEFIKK